MLGTCSIVIVLSKFVRATRISRILVKGIKRNCMQLARR